MEDEEKHYIPFKGGKITAELLRLKLCWAKEQHNKSPFVPTTGAEHATSNAVEHCLVCGFPFFPEDRQERFVSREGRGQYYLCSYCYMHFIVKGEDPTLTGGEASF